MWNKTLISYGITDEDMIHKTLQWVRALGCLLHPEKLMLVQA